MSHPLSLAFLTVMDVDPVTQIRVAAESGFDAVSLRLLPASPAEDDYPLLSDPALLDAVGVALRDTGLVVNDTEIVRLGAEIDWDRITAFCRQSERLGARGVLVAGDDRNEARLIESFAHLCAIASDCGMSANLEFMPWTAVPDLTTAKRVVTATGADNGGVLIDALHYDRSETTTLDQVAALPRAW